MTRLIAILTLLLSCAAATGRAGAQAAPTAAPHLERTAQGVRLIVDGAPFIMLGAQAHNSSGSDAAALDAFWKGIEQLGANTAEVPVYWELVEPEPGRFDFSTVDRIVRGARERHLRLVLLWFASWKNGEMQYTPAWVKQDRRTYARVISPEGDERDVLSPFSTAARDADAKAFAALMAHLRDTDTAHTVVMVQVENEPGLLAVDRDHSELANRAFNAAVPAPLLSYIHAHRDTLAPALAQSLARESGTWTEVFGPLAAEAFSAWSIAQYIDTVAAAGKAAYALPMYVNVWLINPGDERPGRWPSGGATSHVIDVWKGAAPHIDLIAPDIYQPYVERVFAPYVRADNPLFVPEIGLEPYFAAFPLTILAQPSAIGVSPFGVEAPANDKAAAPLQAYARTYRLLKPLLPTIARLQGTGRIHSIAQDLDWGQVISISDRIALVATFQEPFSRATAPSSAIVLQVAPDELIIAGTQVEFVVRDVTAPMLDPMRWAPRQPILFIEEGTLDGDRWIPARRLNGDERWVRFGPDGAILRVKLDRVAVSSKR